MARLVWAHELGVRLFLIQPGKPNQNAYIELFNWRDECLSQICFMTLPPAKALIGQWQREYSEEPSKSALTPATCAQQLVREMDNLTPGSEAACY